MKKFKSLAFLAATLLFIFTVVANSLTLSPLYPETAFLYCLLISAYVLIACAASLKDLFFVSANGGIAFDNTKKIKLPKLGLVLLVTVWVLYFGAHIASSVIFNVSAYKNQMPEFTQGDFSEDFQTMSTSQLPIVDEEMAIKLADKKLGEKPSLGSQVVLGKPTIQQVDDNLVWVLPTYHSGFFKWFSNMDGSPGYVVVSATNPQDVEYVENYKIKYQPGAYFFDDLVFHTRFTAALFTGVTDYSFELDDTGRPFWVVTTYSYKRGFALPEATGVITIDCETGDSEKYSIDNIPDWVDRVQPENFVMTQVNNKGQYVHGIFNFSDKDKFQTSDDQIVVYNNGRCYLFTGLTSVGSDESAIGFILVDMVTKEPTMYTMSGATEYSAKQSAQGKVQQYGYYASFPLIINHNGEPTYFMTLKDKEGLIKQYAYVSFADYQTVGVGESVQEARQNFDKATNYNPSAGLGEDVTITTYEKATGIIKRIGAEFNGVITEYHILLEGDERMFIVPSTGGYEMAFAEDGDEVEINYYPSDEGSVVNAQTFKISNFKA